MNKNLFFIVIGSTGILLAQEPVEKKFTFSAGVSSRMKFKTNSKFTGKGISFSSLKNPITDAEFQQGLGTKYGDVYDDWKLPSSMLYGNAFTFVNSTGSAVISGGDSIDNDASATALDLNLSYPLYQKGRLSLLGTIGFSYMPKQTILNERAPGSASMQTTITTYKPTDPNKNVTDNTDGNGNYYAKDPNNPFGGSNIVILDDGTTSTITQIIGNGEINSELEASELRFMLEPTYYWGELNLGLRTGVVLGFGNAKTSSSVESTISGKTTTQTFSDSQDKCFIQGILGASAGYAISKNTDITLTADMRFSDESIVTEAGPYRTETELNHYSIGISVNYRF